MRVASAALQRQRAQFLEPSKHNMPNFLQMQNGKQCYLGGFETPELAALSFDIACIKHRGLGAASLNYHVGYYEPFVEELDKVGLTIWSSIASGTGTL
jgi:hypothetical protein